MQAVRAENFAVLGWLSQLHQQLRRRYPAARVEQRDISVALVRLNNAGHWNADDEAFWASLKERSAR